MSSIHYNILRLSAIGFTSLMTACASTQHARLLTPLVANHMARPSTSAEISCFLHRLATNYPHVTLLTLGHSVSGQPLHALLLPAAGRAFAMPDDPHRPITFFFLATQHGMEPAGGEALLAIAADLAAQPDPHAQFILMPNMNPDGRDRHRRVNARGVNLSTDFLALSQPETHACVEILRRFRPHVLLDIHESAALKKHSLGAQGFLLDFEAQFEPANNPNVHRALRALAFRKLLPDVLARVARTGLPAQRYIGEITSTNQILTHGGLSLRNVRNFAGIMGTCAFLLENRLDPSTGTYPTPRNIQLRVLKQISCIRAFTDTCRAHERAIRKATYLARRAWDTPTVGHRIWLASHYLPASPHAVRNVPLIRISDGARVFLPFRYHRMIAPANPVSLPTTYLIPPQHPLVPLLRRHNFRLEPTSTGMLCIPTQQPGGLLLPLLLEPVRETPVSNNTGGRY